MKLHWFTPCLNGQRVWGFSHCTSAFENQNSHTFSLKFFGLCVHLNFLSVFIYNKSILLTLKKEKEKGLAHLFLKTHLKTMYKKQCK